MTRLAPTAVDATAVRLDYSSEWTDRPLPRFYGGHPSPTGWPSGYASPPPPCVHVDRVQRVRHVAPVAPTNKRAEWRGYTVGDVATIEEMRAGGSNWTAIAAELGKTPQSLDRWWRRYLAGEARPLPVARERRLSDADVRTIRAEAVTEEDAAIAARWRIGPDWVKALRCHHARQSAGGPCTLRPRGALSKAGYVGYTDADVETIRALRASGETWAVVGRRVGKSRSSVSQWWARYLAGDVRPTTQDPGVGTKGMCG